MTQKEMTLLFLDKENIISSVFAVRVFADACNCESAGMCVGEKQTPPQVYQTLHAHGYDDSPHYPEQVDYNRLLQADKILCLSDGCYKALQKLVPEFLHKTVNCETILCEKIIDPFDMGSSAYEVCFSQIQRLKNAVDFF